MKKLLAIIISFSVFIVAVLLVSTEDDKEKNKKTKEGTTNKIHNGVKNEKPTFESYEGRQLKIAVVGEVPEIKEKELIHFSKLNELKKVHNLNQQKYDAVFIKEYLLQAAEKEYANVYKTSKVPFFFIQSEKIYVAFTNKDLSYDEVPDLSTDGIYAVGYTSKNGGHSFGYGLYNGEENDKNIKNVYTKIFKTIDVSVK